jgi:hypothetical protein
MSKKIEGEKNKAKREAVAITLTSLVGKTYATMSKTEQESFITILGQVANLLDAAGVVKALS